MEGEERGFRSLDTLTFKAWQALAKVFKLSDEVIVEQVLCFLFFKVQIPTGLKKLN